MPTQTPAKGPHLSDNPFPSHGWLYARHWGAPWIRGSLAESADLETCWRCKRKSLTLYRYVNHVYFLDSDAFTSGALWPCRSWHSRDWPIPWASKQLLRAGFSYANLPVWSHIPTTFSVWLTLRATIPIPNRAGPGTRQLKTTSHLLKLFKPAGPKPA